MGIVFGRSKNNIKVLNSRIKETQSLPVVRIQDVGPGNPARSHSYHTALPQLHETTGRLPNFVSDSEDEDPGPYALVNLTTNARYDGPLNYKINGSDQCDLPPINYQHRRTNPIVNVVAELSSDETQTSDTAQYIAREKTALMENILGRRLEELKSRDLQLISRESKSQQYLSSRESYRKTCLKSRKRSRKNSYLTESSISSNNRFSDTCNTDSNKDTGTETDVGTDLLKLNSKRRTANNHGCKLSRRSTLNSALNFSSSTDEGSDYPHNGRLFRKSSTFKRRGQLTREENISQLSNNRVMVTVTASVSGKVTEKSAMNGRVASAWDRKARDCRVNSAVHFMPDTCHEYDAASEGSSSETEDDLNYATRHKTNPFLRTSASVYSSRIRRTNAARDLIADIPVDANVLNMLPEYAKSSYQNTTTSSQHHTAQISKQSKFRNASSQSDIKKASNSSGKTQNDDSKIYDNITSHNITRPSHSIPVKQNDGFDDLDTAVEMLNMLL